MYRWLLRWFGRNTCKFKSGSRVNGKLPDGAFNNRKIQIMKSTETKSIAVIVAHPDDEILWAGGTILSHPTNKWFIVCLCRASDTDRSAKFYKTLKLLHAEGVMGNIDDGPGQDPLDEKELEKYILQLLPTTHFDLIITHDSKGEYTRHYGIIVKSLPVNCGLLRMKMVIKRIFHGPLKRQISMNLFRNKPG